MKFYGEQKLEKYVVLCAWGAGVVGRESFGLQKKSVFSGRSVSKLEKSISTCSWKSRPSNWIVPEVVESGSKSQIAFKVI